MKTKMPTKKTAHPDIDKSLLQAVWLKTLSNVMPETMHQQTENVDAL
jgi:hypothetical protein